jgi:rubrerythrin
METKEALEVLKNTTEAIRKIQSEYSAVKFQNEKLLKFESKSKELTTLNDELKRENSKNKRYYNLLKSVSNHCICDECDGLGGFEYQVGEFELAYDICKKCNEAGILSNTGAQVL